MLNVIRKVTDAGRYGDAMEMATKDFFGYVVKVAANSRPDLRRGGKCYEFKTGAGEIEKLYHSEQPYVMFIPVPMYNEIPAGFADDGTPLVSITIDVERCEGFLFEREAFLQGMESIGAIRAAKKGTDGIRRHCIQTFWNHKKNAPHGALLDRILELGYSESVADFAEWIHADKNDY